MRTEEITIYKFDELPTERAKEAARNWYRECAQHDEWWDYIYDDAENIGVKIKGFDLDRRSIEGKMEWSAGEICQQIIKDHGRDCDTYKFAQAFYAERHAGLTRKFACREDFERDFMKGLLRCYLRMLDAEYEYRNSDEQVEENIRGNGAPMFTSHHATKRSAESKAEIVLDSYTDVHYVSK